MEQEKGLCDYAEQLRFTIVGCSEDFWSGPKYNRLSLVEVGHAVEQMSCQ